MNIKDQIIKVLGGITEAKEVGLEFPENSEFGDYSSNIAMAMFSKSQKTNSKSRGTSKNPRELAEEIVKKLLINKSTNQQFDRIEVAGPGFINFWLKKDVLISNLIQIDSTKEEYGTSDLGKGKTVIVDYYSPNIAKPFGIGHLRSTIIGQAIYNLYKYLGYEVVGDNHVGDWGTQFGKLLYMIDTEKVTDFNIAKLEELYVKLHKLAENDENLEEKAREWFKKLEDGDSEAR